MSSLSEEDRRALDINRRIDEMAAKDHETAMDRVRLLLLGAGESGKSTVFKQMRLLYGTDFTEEEQEYYKYVIHMNIVDMMKALVDGWELFYIKDHPEAPHSFLESMSPQLAQALMTIRGNAGVDDQLMSLDVAAAVKFLWQSSEIQTVWMRRSQLQVVETTSKFLDKLDEVCSFTYRPTRDDILLARVRTTGIVETRYKIDKNVFEMYDVGGQKNERKKWIHAFEGVNAVIFVAALSEYDQTLFEDTSVNRMVDALELFEEIANLPYFENTSMILFLNKSDLFMEKIGRVPIGSVQAFRDYDEKALPPNSYEDGWKYFRDQFLARSRGTKHVYYYLTCATDTNMVAVVFEICKETIIRENLERNGFVE